MGHGGGSGPCKGGDRERLISCSRKAERQIKKVKMEKRTPSNMAENTTEEG